MFNAIGGGIGAIFRVLQDKTRWPVFARAQADLRWRRALFAIVAAGLAGFVLYGCDRSEQHIVAELDRLSRGEGPGEFFARFD